MGRNTNECCFSRVHCGMFSCTVCYLPTGPPPFFSFPPPPSLEPAAVTSFPPHLLPQPYSGNMEPAFRVGCQHCYAHHSSYLLTQGVGGEEEVMAISSELCYLWVGADSSSDLDKASSCWELVLEAWAMLEVGVGLQLTDLKLLVRIEACKV